jgi:hypothetical protein
MLVVSSRIAWNGLRESTSCATAIVIEVGSASSVAAVAAGAPAAARPETASPAAATPAANRRARETDVAMMGVPRIRHAESRQ